ncbi:MAG: biopolymer transporter ExbD [Bacteriovoracales bacterium]|nr:biopolymer transporter ExbD [Bacteriovoracales bacterium]
MRKKRSIRHRKKRSKKGVLDIDITSLLDILVIILVFLLKSYNSSGVLLNVPKGIKLPNSESKNNNTPGIVIQVSPEKIWVDDELVIEKIDSKNMTDHGGRRIIALFDKLVEKKRTIELVKKNVGEEKDFRGKVNLVIDKSVGYHFIRKILYTAAEAEFKEYKFAVLGEEIN